MLEAYQYAREMIQETTVKSRQAHETISKELFLEIFVDGMCAGFDASSYIALESIAEDVSENIIQKLHSDLVTFCSGDDTEEIHPSA